MQEVLTEEQLKKRKLHRARVSLGCMVLILAVGVVGNWYWENSDISTKISTVSAQRTKTLGEATFVDATTEAATENSYFTQAKLDRQSSRDAALEKLQKIVDTADKSAAAHKEAAQKIAKISDGINAENKIETLVTAKGVGQCLAIVSTDGKKVDVIVDSKDLGYNEMRGKNQRAPERKLLPFRCSACLWDLSDLCHETAHFLRGLLLHLPSGVGAAVSEGFCSKLRFGN